jgi:hypothetical protein
MDRSVFTSQWHMINHQHHLEVQLEHKNRRLEDGCLLGCCASETSLNFYQTTRRNNPDDIHLHTRRRENLKSHTLAALRSPYGTFCVYVPVAFSATMRTEVIVGAHCCNSVNRGSLLNHTVAFDTTTAFVSLGCPTDVIALYAA